MEEKNLNQNKPEKKEFASRGVILIAIGALLVVLIVAGTAAWYTRVTAINQLTMDAANFDFKANYSRTPFIIQAKDYINIQSNDGDKAAPGTEGVIPIWVSANESEVEVSYTMKLDFSRMSPEFKKRLRFYFIECEPNGTPKKDDNNHPIEKTFDGSDDITINGSLAPKTGHYEYLYWRWVYELDEKDFYYVGGTYPTYANHWMINKNIAYFRDMYGEGQEADAAKAAFDEFDTKIGLGELDEKFVSESGVEYEKEIIQIEEMDEPIIILAYQKAMSTSIDINGAQAKPTYELATPGEDRKSVVGTYGSGYVPLGELIAIHNERVPVGQ